MNMYEEYLASLEQVEKEAKSALESAGTDADEVLGTEEEAPVEAEENTVEEAPAAVEEPAVEVEDETPVEDAPAEESVEEAPVDETPAEEPVVEEPEVEEEAPAAVEEPAVEEDPKAEFETPEIEEIEVPDENVLTAGNESLLLLDCLYATSSAPEFKDFLSENKVELELYGLVDTDAIARESWADVENDESEVATEARNIVRLNREAQISRETARIAIGLAKQANDTLYKYYHKYSALKREFRDKIYAKYGQRAQALARRSLMNSRSKAAMMNSKTGASIVNKIDSRIKQLDASGRNKEAIQK